MSLAKFESDLIAVFLKDKKKYIRLASRLEEHHFRNEIMKFIFRTYKEYYEKYKDILDLKVFKVELMKTSLETKDKRIYIETFKKLYKKKKVKPIKYLENLIGEKINKENLLNSIEEAIDGIEDGNFEEARDELIRKLTIHADSEEKVIILLKDWKMRQEERRQQSLVSIDERFIPSPFPSLNKLITGIQAAETATIAGLTGMGKSIMLGEFGAHGLIRGFNTIHFPLENTGDQTARRYDSRITAIKYDTIKLYQFTKKELKRFNDIFDNLLKGINSDLKIVELPRNKADFSYVGRVLDKQKAEGFNAKFLLIDSCDIMESTRRFKDYRLDRTSVYWDFKDFCKLRDLHGLTTTQLGKHIKHEIASVEDLAEAYDKARILDLAFLMSQTKDDEKNDIVKFILGKNRDGPKNLILDLFRQGEKMRFLEII
jgi:replicative DNA helicase